MPLQLSKASSEGFHREITCNTTAVNAEWLSTSPFFSLLPYQLRTVRRGWGAVEERGLVCAGGFVDVIYDKVTVFPGRKKNLVLGPEEDLVYCEFHNPSLRLGHNNTTQEGQLCRVLYKGATDGMRYWEDLAGLFWRKWDQWHRRHKLISSIYAHSEPHYDPVKIKTDDWLEFCVWYSNYVQYVDQWY